MQTDIAYHNPLPQMSIPYIPAISYVGDYCLLYNRRYYLSHTTDGGKSMGIKLQRSIVYTFGIQGIYPHAAGGMYYTAVSHIYAYVYYTATIVMEET